MSEIILVKRKPWTFVPGHTNEEQEGSGDESDEEEENGEDEEDDGHPYMLRKVREAPQRYTIGGLL